MYDFFYWNGNINTHHHDIYISQYEDIHYGLFGGHKKRGKIYNEDGIMLLKGSENSRFAVLFDAHAGNSSVIYLQNELLKLKEDLMVIMKLPVQKSIPEMQTCITDMLLQSSQKSSGVLGETAVLFCFQYEAYLWWLSVGDNSLYVFHPEFNTLGQYQINQRIFYQWFGEQSALTLEVPCYQSGTIQLRAGKNQILLLTDGVLEIEGRPYENHAALKASFDHGLQKGIEKLLQRVLELEGTDNASLLTWSVDLEHTPLRPSKSL